MTKRTMADEILDKCGRQEPQPFRGVKIFIKPPVTICRLEAALREHFEVEFCVDVTDDKDVFILNQREDRQA